jgi:hypothetical protein
VTSIVVWPNFELPQTPSLWVVGDTLVSAAGQPLIGDAAKIFILPVICRSPGLQGFFSEEYFSHSLGYCFAGSTLMGQNSYLAIAPLLSNLISVNRYVPSMMDIAEFMMRHLERAYNQYKVQAAAFAAFEVCLFGWCHRENSLEVWHFFPKLRDGEMRMTSTRHASMVFGDFIYLGSHKDHASRLLKEAFAQPSKPGAPSQRAPRRVVQNLIDDEAYPEIGGDQQLAIADQHGFQAYTLLRPRALGSPEAFMSYLGIELSVENSSVGEARVGGPGMA